MAAMGLEIEVLGMGKTYPGHAFKIREMMTYLDTIDDSEHVLFTDAYDVVYLAPAADIISLYEDMCAPIVFNGAIYVPRHPTPHAFAFTLSGVVRDAKRETKRDTNRDMRRKIFMGLRVDNLLHILTVFACFTSPSCTC
jgi:hypothetical protein